MFDHPLPSSVERRVRRLLRSGIGTRWVVAVSGGSDSVGLLRALHAIGESVGLSLSVAHLDHGTRGEASRADAAFVEDLARRLNLPFDLGHWQPTRHGHFEADARAARLAWLHEMVENRQASAVALGHTRDDQAETILHRIIRGTGIHGLAGIPSRRVLGGGVTLIRPVLSESRAMIRDYLQFLNQLYREDATNEDLDRTRARLRHDLLPKLEAEYNPQVVSALVRLGRQASASARAYQNKIVEMERTASAPGNDHDHVLLLRDRLMTFPLFLRAEVIRLAWRRAGWPEAGMGEKRWRRLARLVRRARPGHWDVGAGIVASTGGNLFSLQRAEARALHTTTPIAPEVLPLAIPGAVPWLDGRLIVTLDLDAPRDEIIDLDRVFPPLWVRAPLPGDRFRPLGMNGRETPLNDFFRGRRVPRDERGRTPVLCDEFGIIWVVGHRIADRVRLTEKTTRRAALRWERG